MDAVDLLRRLVEKGYQNRTGYCEDLTCYYCYGDPRLEGREEVIIHEPDCPWLAAKSFLEGPGESPPKLGIEERLQLLEGKVAGLMIAREADENYRQKRAERA